MKTFALDTFKYGLDTRRDVLTSVPGTLVTIENAHINPGGEVERRKAFVEAYDLTIVDDSSIAITSLTHLAGTVTAVSVAHGLATGEFVNISGAVETGYNSIYNVEYIVTVTDANTFTYTVPIAPSASPATGSPVFAYQATFGLESTEDGLIVFGSALPYGATPAQSQPIAAAAMPSGITYQQLQHPSIANDSTNTYNRAYHRLKKIVQSLNYNGKAYVIAEFADGRRFLYYDGALVQHSANGLVMTGRTDLADLATDLGRQVVAVGWTADTNVDENDVAENGSVLVDSPASNFFTAIPSHTSASGEIGAKFIGSVAGTNDVLADAGFTIVNYAQTWDLSIQEDVGPGYTTLVSTLLAAPIVGATSIAATAAAIAQGVNDLTYVHGYTASATATDVVIYAPAGGDVTGPALRLLVTWTTPGTAGAAVAIGSPTLSLEGSLQFSSPLAVVGRRRNEPISLGLLNGTFTALVTGGTPPYSYYWENSDPETFTLFSNATTNIAQVTNGALIGTSTFTTGVNRVYYTLKVRIVDDNSLEVTLIAPAYFDVIIT